MYDFTESQSLFYWIIYSYKVKSNLRRTLKLSLNPYFIGLSILILYQNNKKLKVIKLCLNPYFIGLSILIFQKADKKVLQLLGLNPYFIGLSILISLYLNVNGGNGMSQSLFYWIIYSYHGME